VVEVLEPLEKRYIAQFHRLANFYYECSNLKYLSRLIALPKLPEVYIVTSFGLETDAS
jgi:huntingtin-interacting protein 1-related protein